MATAPKKKSAPKPVEIEPVDAALDEINDKQIVVEFRGEKFVIPRVTFLSVPFSMALARGRMNEIANAILASSQNVRRFVALCEPDELMDVVGEEFVLAVMAVAGQGNSLPS